MVYNLRMLTSPYSPPISSLLWSLSYPSFPMKGDVHAGGASSLHLMILPSFSHRSFLFTPKEDILLNFSESHFPHKMRTIICTNPLHGILWKLNKGRDINILWIMGQTLHICAILLMKSACVSCNGLCPFCFQSLPSVCWTHQIVNLIFYWGLLGFTVLTHVFANDGVCEENCKIVNSLMTVYWHLGNSQTLLQSP